MSVSKASALSKFLEDHWAMLALIPGEKSDDGEQGYWHTSLGFSHEHKEYLLMFSIQAEGPSVVPSLSLINITESSCPSLVARFSTQNMDMAKKDYGRTCENLGLPVDAVIKGHILISAAGYFLKQGNN